MWNGAGWQPAHEPLAFMEPFAGCHVGPWVAAANALNRPVKLTGWGRVGMHNQRLGKWCRGVATSE